jgi:peroxiredoxin
VFVDHPVTDDRGRLRAIVEPGQRQFFVGIVPPGWQFEGTSASLSLVAGREVPVRFLFKRIEEPKVAARRGSALFPEDLVEKWQRQQGLPRSGKFRIRRFFYSLGGRPIPVRDLEAFLDATDLSKIRDPAAALSAGLPSLGKADLSFDSEIIEDGHKQRNTNRTLVTPSETTIAVSNGLEVVAYDCANAHADIFNVNQTGRVGASGLRDLSALFGVPNFRSWLFKDFQGADSSFFEGGEVRRIVASDLLTIEQEKDHATGRWVVDLTTGFVYAHSWRSSRGNVLGELIRQYGPKPFGHRFVLPTVHVEAHLQGLNVNRLNIIVLDDVDLNYRPDPHDFVVAVPAGTAILDNRQDRENPKRATCNYSVADVIKFSEEISSRDRPIGPMLNPGQPAPPIKPASWLDQNGRTRPPDVAGKVVLIDFWDTASEPCVAELPGVQAAADRFAARSKDVVLIGMHVSGNRVEAVAEFARKRGLTYPLAIDRPENGTAWFGATFRAYDVRTIPSAALIDRQGKIVFLGPLREALERAVDLVGP